jgi:hypothetical protein
MKDFAALIAAGTPIIPQVVAAVWHKWFGDSRGETAGEGEPRTDVMTVLAPGLQAIQGGFARK